MSSHPAAPAARNRRLLALLAAFPLAGFALFAVLLLVIVGAVLGPPPQTSGADSGHGASAFALRDIPRGYLSLYQDAAARYGLDWTVLAAIGKVETDHGRSSAPGVRSGQNAHGCCAGPMQFWTAPPHPNTWDRYGVDGNHDGRADPYDPADAIPAAARYLKASGAPADWARAIFAYNHAGWYVTKVQRVAARYRSPLPVATDRDGGGRLGWPLTGELTSRFGPRSGRMHEGIDIAAPTGTPIHASESGQVSFAGTLAGYGAFLCITHQPDLTSCYAHLSQLDVKADQEVARGEVVALSGCSGRCDGPHLHFEAHEASRWSHESAVDPLDYLTPQHEGTS